MSIKMCFNARIDNETKAALVGKTSNVTWAVVDDDYNGYGDYLVQAYEEPMVADIMCICPVNRTNFKFEKTTPWPVNLLT